MSNDGSDSTYKDRWGLGIGKLDSDRRRALIDPETGEPHQMRLTDLMVARRTSEIALELLRIFSHQGRAFIDNDTLVANASVLNALTMSEDSLALFDGVRESRRTANEIRGLVKGLVDAAQRQRNDVVARAHSEADADAAAYPGRVSVGLGGDDRTKQ